MMKTISYLKDRGYWRYSSLLSILLMLLVCSDQMHAEEYTVEEVTSLAWVGGTAPGQGELITISSEVLSIPDDPMVNDTVCFTHTATNISGDTLEDVAIIVADQVITFMSELGPFTGTGSGVMTGSSCHALTQSDIDAGYFDIDAIVQGSTQGASTPDAGDCTTAIACWDVRLSCQDYNISLDAACETILTAEFLQIKSNLDHDLIRVRIQEDDGSFRPTALVESSDVGRQLKVVVDIPGCDNVSPCWSYANIEYKLLPSQVCSRDTVTCIEAVADAALPVITSACGPTQLIRSETVRVDLCRTSSEFLAKETTVYSIVDGFGNVSDTCVQERYIRPANIERSDILWPADTVRLSCDADIFNDRGEVLPRYSGAPFWRSPSGELINLTLDMLTPMCNVDVDFEDSFSFTRNCETTVARKWTVTEWRCEGGFVSYERRQIFRLIDNTGPSINLTAADMTLSVNQNDCTAAFTIPDDFTVSDNCQAAEDIEVEIRYLGGSSLIGATFPTISLPLGTSIVEYIARDGCGNESRDSLTVTVIDQTDPVAVCLRSTSISIPNSTERMTVDQFDEDAYDACEIDRKCVVRMDHFAVLQSLGDAPDYAVLFSTFDDELISRGTSCYRNYSANTYTGTDGKEYIDRYNLCLPDVIFCCEDAGQEVAVIYRVYDMAGNDNACMVMVEVQDKSAPVVTCPASEIIVSCDYEFDAYSNDVLDSLFGTIRQGNAAAPVGVDPMFLLDHTGDLVDGTFEDNCNIGEVDVNNIVNIDSMCGTGTIIREFRIIRGGETTLECTQTIRIRGDQNNNPLMWAPGFEDSIRIMPGSPQDIRELALLHPPHVMDAGCSSIGVGYRDQFFQGDSPEHCTKVIRTWEVIDWCRAPNADIQLQREQVIYLDDSTAPEISLEANASGPASETATIKVVGTDNLVSDARQLKWDYTVVRQGSTTVLISDTLGFADFSNKTTGTITIPSQSAGTYILTVTAEDKCGNVGEATQTIVRTNTAGSTVDVSGAVLLAKSQTSMDNINVYLTTQREAYDDGDMRSTDTDGLYAFANMPTGGNYFLDPEKDDDHINGVTVVDLVLMQRHILGMKKFVHPADYIAADVNDDGKVSALDLVEVRRLILGSTDRFAHKDSWTFVYDGQDLEDVALRGQLAEETYYIDGLTGDMDIAFVGIKNGDVSGDAVGHSAGVGSSRSLSQTNWTYSTQLSNDWMTVHILATKDMDIAGAQTTFAWTQDADLVQVLGGALDITADDYAEGQGQLTLAYANATSTAVREGEVLLTMILDASDMHTDLDMTATAVHGPSQVFDGVESSALVLSKEILSIEELTLQQNRPNPWSNYTEIVANIPSAGTATLSIYDLQQRLIHKTTAEVVPGTHRFTVDNGQVAQSGLYFYEVEINGLVAREKMLRVN